MKDLFRDHHKKKNLEGPSHPNGRSCAHPGCITLLSITTPGPYCRHHTEKEADKKMKEEIKKYNYDGMPVGKHSAKK